MRIASIAILLLLALAIPASGQPATPAPFVVIVHRDNPSTSITRSFLVDALLKRATRWPDGETIRPVDLPIDSPTRRHITTAIMQRTVQAIRSYWQQMIFSGRGVPPVELSTEREVVRYVATHRGAIGYVSGSTDTRSVRVVTLR